MTRAGTTTTHASHSVWETVPVQTTPYANLVLTDDMSAFNSLDSFQGLPIKRDRNVLRRLGLARRKRDLPVERGLGHHNVCVTRQDKVLVLDLLIGTLFTYRFT